MIDSQMRGMWGAEGGGHLHYENNFYFKFNKGARNYICMKIAF